MRAQRKIRGRGAEQVGHLAPPHAPVHLNGRLILASRRDRTGQPSAVRLQPHPSAFRPNLPPVFFVRHNAQAKITVESRSKTSGFQVQNDGFAFEVARHNIIANRDLTKQDRQEIQGLLSSGLHPVKEERV